MNRQGPAMARVDLWVRDGALAIVSLLALIILAALAVGYLTVAAHRLATYLGGVS